MINAYEAYKKYDNDAFAYTGLTVASGFLAFMVTIVIVMDQLYWFGLLLVPAVLLALWSNKQREEAYRQANIWREVWIKETIDKVMKELGL